MVLLAHASLTTACLRSASECSTSSDCDTPRVCELGQCVIAATDAGALDVGSLVDAEVVGVCEPYELMCQGACAVCGLGFGISYGCEGPSCVETGCESGHESCDDGCCLAPPVAPFEVDGEAPAVLPTSLDLHADIDGSLWLSFIEPDGSLGVANWTARGWRVQRALVGGCEGTSSITDLVDTENGLLVAAWCDRRIAILESGPSGFVPSSLADEVEDLLAPEVIDFEVLVTPTMRAIAYTTNRNPTTIEITVREIGEDASVGDVITRTGGVSQLAFTTSDREVLAVWVEPGGEAHVNLWRADGDGVSEEGWATPAPLSEGVVAIGLVAAYIDGPTALVVRRDPWAAQLHQITYTESEASFVGPNTVATGGLVTDVSRVVGGAGFALRSAFGLFDLAGGVTYVEETEEEWRVRSGRVGCNATSLSPRAFALTEGYIVAASAGADGVPCIESIAR